MSWRRRRDRERERGAVMVIVAVSMTAMIGAAAVAVDLGHTWESQRRLRTSTDAAALAAAATEAERGNGCVDAAGDFVSANDPDAEMTSCQLHVNGTGGYVSVSATREVDFNFAKIFGVDSTDVNSTTHAMYGIPTGANGLRPMALCIDAHEDLSAWLNLPDGPIADSEPMRIGLADNVDACGGAPGNWGLLAFEESQSNNDTKNWVANGYPNIVSLSTITGNTGSFNPSIDSQLTTLVGMEFAIPIFDHVENPGANAQFNVVAFAWVKLTSVQLSGAQADRYLELQFLAHRVLEGTCCGSGGPDTGVRAVRICGTDPDAVDGCVAEDGS